MKFTKKQTEVIKGLISNAKGRSKDPQKTRGNSEFNLTEAWVKEQIKKQGGKCPYTGVPYSYDPGKSWHGRCGNPRRPSINRLNPMQGYTMDNCEVTSNWWNSAIKSWQIREIIPFIRGAFFRLIKRVVFG